MIDDLRQTEVYARYMSMHGWEVLGTSGRWAYRKRLPGGFSIVKAQRVDCGEIEKLVARWEKETASGYIKIEPNIDLSDGEQVEELDERLRRMGFRPDKWPLLPSTTTEIDLQTPWDNVEEEFSVLAKRNIKKAKGHGLVIEIGDEKKFYEQWKAWSKRRRVPILSEEQWKRLLEAFGTEGVVMNCMEKDVWVGGVLLLKAGERMYYYQAASNERGHEVRAADYLVYEGLKLAKKMGCVTWDFEGIADERFAGTNSKDWQGFGKFKLKFGGKVKRYMGSYSRYYGWGRVMGWMERVMG